MRDLYFDFRRKKPHWYLVLKFATGGPDSSYFIVVWEAIKSKAGN